LKTCDVHAVLLFEQRYGLRKTFIGLGQLRMYVGQFALSVMH